MKLNLPFDHVCVIVHCQYPQRQQLMKEQIQKINAEDITEFRYVDSMPNVFKPISDNIFHNDRCKLPGNEYVNNNCLSCYLNHYWAIKTSYERGYNNVLILEDDIFFIFVLNMIHQTFDNIPKDYKMIKFSQQLHTVNNSTMYLFPNGDNGIQEFHKEYIDYKSWGSAGYMLSREGMKELIDIYNSEIMPADNIMYKLNNKNEIYITKYQILLFSPLCCQSNIDKLNYSN